MKRSTIKDVARMADVSVVTVSRVVNAPERVQADTRERVTRAMQALGYSPNVAAQSMRTRLTRSIGFLTPELSSPTNAAVAQAAEQALARAGYTMLVASSNYEPEREVLALELLRVRRVDGIILYVSDEQDAKLLKALRACDVPMVLLDRSVPIESDQVWSDHAGAMSKIVQYLADLGHRSVGLVQRRLRARPAVERRRAFDEACTAAKLPFARVVQLPVRNTSQHALPVNLFVGQLAPTALIVEGVALLRAVLEGCRHHRLTVPEQRSVVGIDTLEVTSLTTPETTTIARDFEAVGRTAAQLMLHRLSEAATPPQRVVLDCEVLFKGSCAPPPGRRVKQRPE